MGTFKSLGKGREMSTDEEADRSAPLPRIQTIAERVFAFEGKADIWPRQPLAEPRGGTPRQVARTGAGARRIEAILAKIICGAAD
jgi:uncharacterized protein (DUF2384 family)